MESMTRKRNTIRTRRKSAFEYDLEDVRERSKPAPRGDVEGTLISQALSRINERAQTGFVTDWKPEWLPAEVDPFRYFFFEDKLIVDAFSVPVKEMDVMAPTAQWIERNISIKGPLCDKAGLIYIPVRPDEELDMVQLAARIGKARITKRIEVDKEAQINGQKS